jgi:hypothetical protein
MKIRFQSRHIEISILKKWSALNLKNKPTANLELRARVEKAGPYTSISHARSMGGFAFCRTSPVGFDIEECSRELTPKAFKRLTLSQERKLPLTPIEFWVAKEAAWKSLRGPAQPATIISISILSVRKRGLRKHFTYSVNTSDIDALTHLGGGLILKSQRMIMGIALPLSQL